MLAFQMRSGAIIALAMVPLAWAYAKPSLFDFLQKVSVNDAAPPKISS